MNVNFLKLYSTINCSYPELREKLHSKNKWFRGYSDTEQLLQRMLAYSFAYVALKSNTNDNTVHMYGLAG
jgi:hypothetical protein